jgi:uncharacterized membrane protein YphA (DoxX/SURF4 family)
MTLLRAAARTMLASYFIASGVKALRDPDALVPDAEPVTDKVVPLVKEYAPEQVASFVPEDARTLVRLHGATQLVGGLALASGKGRRLGALLLAYSLIPSTVAKHPFWSRTDPAERAHDQHQVLKNVSLLGGVLLAAGDTEGRPSLAWWAQKGGKTLAKTTGKFAKRAESLTEGGSDLAESALAGGAALVGTVVASTRRARKQATKQFARAQEIAAKQAEEARKAAIKAGKQAKKDAPKQLAAAKKLAAERVKEARELAAERAKEAQKVAVAKQKAARKEEKRAKHIQRGEN